MNSWEVILRGVKLEYLGLDFNIRGLSLTFGALQNQCWASERQVHHTTKHIYLSDLGYYACTLDEQQMTGKTQRELANFALKSRM